MKRDTFLSKLSGTEKVWSGVLSIFTLFALLSVVAPGWYAQMPRYQEWICGLTTWSGYNKQADMQVIQSILLGLPVLFLCFAYLISFWKRKVGREDSGKIGILFLVGYLFVLVMILAQKQYAFFYLGIGAVLFIGYLLLYNCEKKINRSAEAIGVLFGKIVMAILYLNLALVSILLAANAFLPGIGEYWQKYPLVPVVLEGILFLLLCGVNSLQKMLPHFNKLQFLLPLAWIGFAHFRYFYEGEGALMELFYSGRWKWFCVLVCVLLLALLVWEWHRSGLSQKKERNPLFFTTFIMAGVLRIFSQPDGILSVDYFHNGEISMPMQQLLSYGKLPYEDLIPIHGLCDYFYGVINYMFFDGTYLSLNSAKIVGDVVMAVLLAGVIYFFVENKWQGFFLVYGFMPFMIKTAGMRYLFVFILFLVLFSPKMKKGLESLYGWVLLSIFAIAWNAAIGGAAAMAFLPVILYRGKRDIPGQLGELFARKPSGLAEKTDKKMRKGRILLSWIFLALLGIGFIPLFLQIVVYLMENTGTTLYVNGMEMLEEVSLAASYFVPEIVGGQNGFFLTAFGFLIPLIVSFGIFLGEKKTGGGELFVTLLLGFWVFANYSFVRYDEGLRSTVLGTFFLLLLAVTLLYGRMQKEWKQSQNDVLQESKNGMLVLYALFWGLALFLSDDSPLITSDTLAFQQNVPAYVDTVIRGEGVQDPVVYVSGDSVAMPNLGTGFIQGNTLASLQNVQKVLQGELADGKTCFDATNAVANAVIFDIPSYLPYTSVYNISNGVMQDKAIAMLEGNLPDMILMAPYIQFDEAPFSFRSTKLYRFLMEQDYIPYKYENVIYLVREESHVEGAGEDLEAFAQLMHKVDMNHLPAVWGSNMANVQETKTWDKVDVNARIEATEKGFDVIFDTPVDGGEIDMLKLGNLQYKTSEIQSELLSQEQEDKKEISMWLESEVAKGEEIEYRFTLRQDCNDTYILPVCTSPYFTGEESIEKLSFTYEGNWDIPADKIIFEGYKISD